MTLTRSLPTQHASGLPLIDERRTTMGLFARNADGSVRTGVLPSHQNALVTGRASMGYDIAAFNAVTARTAAGAEQIANDGSVTVTTTAAPTANSRIDAIYVRAQFVVLGDASNDVIFGVVQGTAAVSPAKPSIPAGALELATATIPSTATTTTSSGVVITPTHPYTAAAGGIVLMRSLTERDAWAAPENAIVRVIGSGAEYRRVGAAWERRVAGFTQTARVANPSVSQSSPATLITLNLPADAPEGNYRVDYTVISDGGTQTRFHQVTWAGSELTNWATDSIPNCTGGLQVSDTLTKLAHPGGAAAVVLVHQNNGSSPSCRMARLTVTYIGP